MNSVRGISWSSSEIDTADKLVEFLQKEEAVVEIYGEKELLLRMALFTISMDHRNFTKLVGGMSLEKIERIDFPKWVEYVVLHLDSGGIVWEYHGDDVKYFDVSFRDADIM